MDRITAFVLPMGNAWFERFDRSARVVRSGVGGFCPLAVLMVTVGCATSTPIAEERSRPEPRQPAAREGVDHPLSRASLALSTPKVADGAVLTLTLKFPEGADPGDASLLSGSFGEVNFPFFPLSVSEPSKGYGAIVGIPLGYPPGLNHVFVHLSSSPQGRPEFTREEAFEIVAGEYRREILSVDPSKVDPPARARARIEREREEVKALYRNLSSDRFLLSGFGLPVKSAVTSPYGSQRIYNGMLKSAHTGLDLRAPVGRRIYSSAPGRVVLAKDLYYTGNTVIVDHGFGVFTLYAHLSRIGVKQGQEVPKGGLLGSAGATGRVTGPHLHWSAIVHQVKVNPVELTKVVW